LRVHRILDPEELRRRLDPAPAPSGQTKDEEEGMALTPTTEHQGSRYECAMCREPVTMTEKDGLGYCDVHWRAVHPQRLRRLIRSIHRAPAPTRVAGLR
jgi:hypothetical protein